MSQKKPRRGRRPLPETERKDRLVQARIDEELDEALRQAARQKRMTVSQLIRGILENTFHLVDDVVAGAASLSDTVVRDARRIADAARGLPTEPAPVDKTKKGKARRGEAVERDVPPIESVTTWLDVRIGREARCSRCERLLHVGEQALSGATNDRSDPRVLLCRACAETLGVLR